ncbi:unnamed protein product, partial [Ceratitis capitata]
MLLATFSDIGRSRSLQQIPLVGASLSEAHYEREELDYMVLSLDYRQTKGYSCP